MIFPFPSMLLNESEEGLQFVGVNSGSESNATPGIRDFFLAFPAGTESGDLALLFVYSGGDEGVFGNFIIPPIGWVPIENGGAAADGANSRAYHVCYRLIQPGDTAPEIEAQSNSNYLVATMQVWRGATWELDETNIDDTENTPTLSGVTGGASLLVLAGYSRSTASILSPPVINSTPPETTFASNEAGGSDPYAVRMWTGRESDLPAGPVSSRVFDVDFNNRSITALISIIAGISPDFLVGSMLFETGGDAGSFQVPAGVTVGSFLAVGAGGGRSPASFEGGAGGGAATMWANNVALTPGEFLDYHVGEGLQDTTESAPACQSWVRRGITDLVLADYGRGGPAVNSANGAGGLVANSVGDAGFNGTDGDGTQRGGSAFPNYRATPTGTDGNGVEINSDRTTFLTGSPGDAGAGRVSEGGGGTSADGTDGFVLFIWGPGRVFTGTSTVRYF